VKPFCTSKFNVYRYVKAAAAAAATEPLIAQLAAEHASHQRTR
jgi:hypothetical protein